MVFEWLGVSTLALTTMKLLMADRSIKRPVEILNDVLAKVNKFIFLVAFIVLDYDLDTDVPITLG